MFSANKLVEHLRTIINLLRNIEAQLVRLNASQVVTAPDQPSASSVDSEKTMRLWQGVRKSKPGKSIYFEVGVWYDDKFRDIHLVSTVVKGLHVTVTNNPGSKRGHEALFKHLARALEAQGAPHPELPPEPAKK